MDTIHGGSILDADHPQIWSGPLEPDRWLELI